MATFQKRGKKWRAIVRYRGTTTSKTFRTKSEAQQWALDAEVDLERNKYAIPDKSVGDLLTYYADNVSVKKRSRDWERKRIRTLQKDPLCEVKLPDLSSADIALWRDRELKKHGAGTVLRDWTLLNHAFALAIREWKWLRENPMSTVKKPKEPPPRTRRISQEETETIIVASGYQREGEPVTLVQRACIAFLFALETAARAGEIAGIEPEDVHEDYVHLRKTKNGDPRDVPLSKEAKRLLKQIGYTWGMTGTQISYMFAKVRDRSGLEGLQFRDSRAEALTRLSKIFDVLELARISGHKDLKILLNVYYRPTVSELAEKLD